MVLKTTSKNAKIENEEIIESGQESNKRETTQMKIQATTHSSACLDTRWKTAVKPKSPWTATRAKGSYFCPL